MTGADRQSVAHYEEGDIVRCTRGSQTLASKPESMCVSPGVMGQLSARH